MNVSELMSPDVRTCTTRSTLDVAAQMMWEGDCGCVLVVDDERRVVGILTDRDICMAGFTQGKRYADIPVSTAMAIEVFTVNETDSIETAEMLMREKQIRRLPVVDGLGRLRGVLSLNDLARNARARGNAKNDGLTATAITQTLCAICAPRAPKSRQLVVDISSTTPAAIPGSP